MSFQNRDSATLIKFMAFLERQVSIKLTLLIQLLLVLETLLLFILTD